MRVAYADFETNLFNYTITEYVLKPTFVVVKYLGKHYVFHKSEKFVRFLDQHSSYRDKLLVFFHNLKFDSLFFIQDLVKRFRFIQPTYSGSRLLRLRIGNTVKTRKKSGRKYFDWKIEFRDSASLIPVSLRKIGMGIGLLKGNTEQASLDENAFVEYCKRDCDILEQAIQQLLQVVNAKTGINLTLNNLPLTSPALAKLVLNFTMGKQLEQQVYNDIFDQDLRPYYFGGRTEVFSLQEHRDVYYNDFNSAYPYTMHHNVFPLAPYHKTYGNWEKWLAEKNFVGGVFTVDESGIYIPMFPERHCGKVCFFASEKKVFLFREELEYFINRYGKNRVKKMHWGLICSKWAKIFEKYVDIFYGLKSKAESRSYERIVYKLFLNSPYGKFGESSEKEIFKIYADYNAFLEENPETEVVNTEDTPIGVVYRKKSTQRVKNNVLIAMRITALTRLHLYKYMEKVGFTNVIYCDTDSIVSTKLIENSKELGKMSPEFNAKRFRALGSKEYWIEIDETETKTKMKGFSIREQLTYDEFLKIYIEGKQIHQVLSLKQCLIRKKDFGTSVNAVKQKHNLYDKREILPDLSTKPIIKKEFNIVKLRNEQIIKSKILSKHL